MLNMDFSAKVVVETSRQSWVASPMPGVWRKPLAREEAERGHATSIVRYDPGARFKRHDHPRGEEILVLGGTFSDETGDYPAGTYFRNPRGFQHAPFSEKGCVLLVKLHQFQADDTRHVVVDTLNTPFTENQAGMQVLVLHRHKAESVTMVRWPPGESLNSYRHSGGDEIYVICGELRDECGIYPAGTWIRTPHDIAFHPCAERETRIWVKTGHLNPASR